MYQLRVDENNAIVHISQAKKLLFNREQKTPHGECTMCAQDTLR